MKSDPLSRWILSCIHVLIRLPRYSTLVRSDKLSPYQPLFFWRTVPESWHPQNFLAKIPFFLKINSPDCAPFWGVSDHKYAYWLHFYGPGEKYRQLGELLPNLCGGIVASTVTIKKWKKNDWSGPYPASVFFQKFVFVAKVAITHWKM
jgi:hypothetical protein